MKKDCLKDLIGLFPDVEPEVIQKFINDTQAVRDGTSSLEDFLKISAEEMNNFSKAQIQRRKTLVDDFLSKQRNLEILKHPEFVKDLRPGFLALTYGHRLVPGSQYSAASNYWTALTKWHSMYEEGIVNKGLHKLFESSLMEDLVNNVSNIDRTKNLPGFRELREVNTKWTEESKKFNRDVRIRMFNGANENTPLPNEVSDQALTTYDGRVDQGAGTVAKIYENIREMKNAAGGFVAKVDGYAGMQHHNDLKVLNAVKTLKENNIEVPQEILKIKDPMEMNYKAWRWFFEPMLNAKETMARIGNNKSHWNESWKDISFNRVAPELPFDKNPKSAYNIVASMSRSRKFIFNDGESFAWYQEVFGNGSVLDDLVLAMDQSAKEIGMLKTFGSTPKEATQTLIKDMETHYKKLLLNPKTEKIGQSGLNSIKEGSEYIKGMVDGLQQRGGGSSSDIESLASKGLMYFRTAQVPLKLGQALFSQIDDIVSSTSLIASSTGQSFVKTGVGWTTEFVKTLATMFPPTKYLQISNERYVDEITATMGIGLDYTLSERMGAYDAQDLPRGVLSKSIKGFFLLNGMQVFGTASKNASRIMLGKILADQVMIPFNELNPAMKNIFESYGINSEAQLNQLRKGIIEVESGYKFFPKLKLLSPHALGSTETGLIARTIFNDAVELGTNMAMNKQRFQMYGNTKTNSILGEAVRSVLQFAGPNWAIIENGSRVYRANPNAKIPFTEKPWADLGLKGDPVNYAKWASWMIAASAAKIYIVKKIQGKDFDPTDPVTAVEIAAGSGVMGFLTDRILAEYERGGRDKGGALRSTVLGPSIGQLTTGVGLATTREKVSEKEKALFKKSLTPGNNLWWLNFIEKNMILNYWLEQNDPDWKNKEEKRQIREQRRKGH